MSPQEAAIEAARAYLAAVCFRGRFFDPRDAAGTTVMIYHRLGKDPPQWAMRLILPDNDAVLRHLLSKPKRRGRPRLHARDFWICVAIDLVRQRGFTATRGQVTREKRKVESACSLMAKALARLGVRQNNNRPLSEAAVEKIWRGSSRRVLALIGKNRRI